MAKFVSKVTKLMYLLKNCRIYIRKRDGLVIILIHAKICEGKEVTRKLHQTVIRKRNNLLEHFEIQNAFSPSKMHSQATLKTWVMNSLIDLQAWS